MATKIIAEAGVNHNGSLAIALRLVEEAKKAGADAVKFQSFKASSLASQNAPLAKYQTRNVQYNEQIEMLSSLELSNAETKQISNYCDEIGIEFISSPFGVEELNFLLTLGMKSIKIPSGEITNLQLLREISKISYKKRMDILLSTGMSNLGDIESALSILNHDYDNFSRITILHCTSSYPAPKEELNLYAIKTISNSFKCNLGYSDHSEGILAPVIAVSLGATVLEKHITLDRNLPGPDHKASIEINDFSQMVRNIRDCELMLGSGIKEIQLSESDTLKVARRSIRASRKINLGQKILEEDLICQRPADGLSPLFLDKIVGTKASRSYDIGELVFELK